MTNDEWRSQRSKLVRRTSSKRVGKKLILFTFDVFCVQRIKSFPRFPLRASIEFIQAELNYCASELKLFECFGQVAARDHLWIASVMEAAQDVHSDVLA